MSAGKAICLMLSNGLSVKATYPVGTTFPHQIAGSEMINVARTKLGMESPKMVNNCNERSIHESWRIAAMHPAGIAIETAKSDASKPNSSVGGKRLPTSLATVSVVQRDSPRSPRTRSRDQIKNWTGIGLSSPNCFSSRWVSAFDWPTPTFRSTTLPGIIRRSANDPKRTRRTTGIVKTTRRSA